MTLYYITRPGGERQGPFPESTVRANMQHDGFYAANTLIWCKGMADWKPLSEVFATTSDIALPPAAQETPHPPSNNHPASEEKPELLTRVAETPATRIYYVAERGGERRGPFTLAELRAESAQHTPNTVVWRKGMADWVAASSLLLKPEKHNEACLPHPSLSSWASFFYPAMSGRVGVVHFWLSQAILLAAFCLGSSLLDALHDYARLPSPLPELTFIAFMLAGIVSFISLLVARLHDSGISGLLAAFLLIIPFIGWLMLGIFCLAPGDKEANKYGHPRPLT